MLRPPSPEESALLALLLVHASLPAALAVRPTLDADLGISVFGLGVKATLNPGLEQPLWNEEGDLLFDDTWLGLTLRLEATPAFARVGPELRFSPAAVLEARAHAMTTGYFGNFSALIGYEHPNGDYSPEGQDDAIRLGQRSAGRATDLGFDVTINGQVGPVVVTATGAWSRWSFEPGRSEGYAYYYETEYILMMRRSGEILQQVDGALLYELDPGGHEEAVLYLGSYSSLARTAEAEDQVMRTGAVMVWMIDEHWTWYVLAQVNLIDRVYGPFPPFMGTLIAWEL